MTLFGGYNGLGPPPRRKRIFDRCSGTTAVNVPPENSGKDQRDYPPFKNQAITTLADELEGHGLIDCETSRGRRREYLTVCIETRIEYVDRVC